MVGVSLPTSWNKCCFIFWMALALSEPRCKQDTFAERRAPRACCQVLLTKLCWNKPKYMQAADVVTNPTHGRTNRNRQLAAPLLNDMCDKDTKTSNFMRCCCKDIEGWMGATRYLEVQSNFKQ